MAEQIAEVKRAHMWWREHQLQLLVGGYPPVALMHAITAYEYGHNAGHGEKLDEQRRNNRA